MRETVGSLREYIMKEGFLFEIETGNLPFMILWLQWESGGETMPNPNRESPDPLRFCRFLVIHPEIRT